MTDDLDPDQLDADTVDLMAALLMMAGADMIEPGTAVLMLLDETSPFADVDELVTRAAVETVKAVAEMGDVTPDDLAAFTGALRGYLDAGTNDNQEGN